jgi:hypothetical protein
LEDEGVFVFEQPFKVLAFLQANGFGQGDWEIDVVAAVGGAFDFLNFDGVSHEQVRREANAVARKEHRKIRWQVYSIYAI